MVDPAAPGVAQQAARHGFLLYLRIDRQLRIERQLRPAVGDELDSPEEAAAANVADMRMIAEHLRKHRSEFRAAGPDLGEQAIAPDHLRFTAPFSIASPEQNSLHFCSYREW